MLQPADDLKRDGVSELDSEIEKADLAGPEDPNDQPEAVRDLVRAYLHVAETAMQDVFICNPALSVEAVGFRDYRDGYLGILITPWFVNLMIIGDEPEDESLRLSSGQKRKHAFPSGHYEFITSDVEGFGRHQSLSLFSPAMEFEDQQAARLTAIECLKAIFQEDAKDDSLEPGENLPILGIKDLMEAGVNTDNATPVDPAWFAEDSASDAGVEDATEALSHSGSVAPEASEHKVAIPEPDPGTSKSAEKALETPMSRRSFLRPGKKNRIRDDG